MPLWAVQPVQGCTLPFLPEFDQIRIEFMQLGGRIACSGVQKLFIQ